MPTQKRKTKSKKDLKDQPKIERRMLDGCDIRAIKDDNGNITQLEGYAIVFNELSDDLGGFREMVAPGAAGKSIRKRTSDVRALHNHDRNFVWGRQKAKTLKMKEDDYGLKVNIFPDPEIGWQRDLIHSIERGDIDQMSFGFYTIADEWRKENGMNIRTLKAVDVQDISTVTFAAYPQTSIGVRSVMERAGLDYEGIERALVRMEHELDLEEEDRGVIASAVETLNSLLPQESETADEEEETDLELTPRLRILKERQRLRNRNFDMEDLINA